MLEEVVLGMDMKAIFSDDWMLLRASGDEVKIEIYPTGVGIFSMMKQVVINFSLLYRNLYYTLYLIYYYERNNMEGRLEGWVV